MNATLSSWDHVTNPTAWHALHADEQLQLGECLRDSFIALSRTSNANPESFRRLVAAVESTPATRVGGLAISFHPSSRFTATRFVDIEHIDETLRSHFARPTAELPHLALVFIDPQELSFRTFENIVPLDRMFARSTLDVALTNRSKLDSPDRYRFDVEASDATRATLERLDALDLYVAPLNAVSRGGQRYVFHSALLSEALTQAVRDALPRALLGDFSHVNPVFRCNRFEPGDDDFHAHLDTPYFDRARNHVSRYTLILYVTGGSGQPALRIHDTDLTDIAAFSCVIFDQRLEHSGAPFDDGRKVFLRTELIFEDASVKPEPSIAKLFSKACYLTGESVFAPELASSADGYYNRVAAAHWNGLAASGAAPEVFVHKEFRGTHFIANGYDFWFPKSAGSPRECAVLTLLDYFNCSIHGAPFRSLCKTETLADKQGDAWIDDFLAGLAPSTTPALTSLDKSALFPAPEKSSHRSCCPFHAANANDFDASRCSDIIDFYSRAQDFAKEHIMPAPVMMLGQEVFLDPTRFVVTSNAIHVLSADRLAPVNFAACWNFGGSPANYVDVATSLSVLQPLVPPILFRETKSGYHLMFDFFKNDWMVAERRDDVPVPRIAYVHPAVAEDEGNEPWIDAAHTMHNRSTKKLVSRPWWASETSVTRELYGEEES